MSLRTRLSKFDCQKILYHNFVSVRFLKNLHSRPKLNVERLILKSGNTLNNNFELSEKYRNLSLYMVVQQLQSLAYRKFGIPKNSGTFQVLVLQKWLKSLD